MAIPLAVQITSLERFPVTAALSRIKAFLDPVNLLDAPLIWNGPAGSIVPTPAFPSVPNLLV
ncbi:hypothetical protein TH53_13520 [Pedobacter lusitanus]|uniref:Uncharacterized protein n=1 Tax=Pedobacter lusitanus TaxID=1503925 RepID=A0A0D0GKH3_9SPHI|nr:hypothetical protein TH53_13520 [Pedobacter lusitanus]